MLGGGRGLARFERVGHRTTGDRYRRREGAGYAFFHVAIDTPPGSLTWRCSPMNGAPPPPGFLVRALRGTDRSWAWSAPMSLSGRRAMPGTDRPVLPSLTVNWSLRRPRRRRAIKPAPMFGRLRLIVSDPSGATTKSA